jgi:hypothetical protein
MQQRQKSPSISLTEVHVTHACMQQIPTCYSQRGQGSSSQPVPVQSSVSIYSADAAGEIANHCNVAICLAAMNPSTCLGFANHPSAWIKSTVGIIRRRVRLLQATCTDVRMSSTEEDAGAFSQRSAAPGPQPVREKDGQSFGGFSAVRPTLHPARRRNRQN